jgi:5'(3')-deoxyribonucleotidase
VKRLLLDVDGPLTASFAEFTCRELRLRGVERAQPGDITDWDIFACFGVKGTEVEKRVYAAMGAPGYCEEFEPRAGALAFCRWARERLAVYAVTAALGSSPTWAHDRERWLKDQLEFDGKRVIFAADKSPVAGDMFVDDKPSNLVDWQAANPGKLAVLWRATYNRDFAWPHVANNYLDLAAYVAEIERARL